MQAQYPNPQQPPGPGTASRAPSQASHEDPLFLVPPEKLWFITLFENLRESFSAKPQGPMQVSFRPLSAEELAASDDPMLRRLAELNQKPKGFFARVSENVREIISPPPPPPVTSRPLTKEELTAMGGTFVEMENAERPWYQNLYLNLKDLLFLKKLPPLQVTSKPVQVRELFGRNEYKSRSQAISFFVHVGMVVLALTLGTSEAVQTAVKQSVSIFTPVDIAPYVPQAPVKQQAMGGGGGGGTREITPPSKGRLPRQSLKQFTPPAAVIMNENPKLVMEPTILVPPDVALPNTNMPNFGDPLAKLGPPSGGPGSGGGIGKGSGGGVGPGRGGGYGEGEGGGAGGGAFRIGGGVSAPQPIFKVEPEYSEEARKAKYQGTVLLAIVVDEEGRTRNIRVVRSLGMGLDEKAIDAVSKWRFRPGYKDGRAVAVQANVEVNFRLL